MENNNFGMTAVGSGKVRIFNVSPMFVSNIAAGASPAEFDCLRFLREGEAMVGPPNRGGALRGMERWLVGVSGAVRGWRSRSVSLEAALSGRRPHPTGVRWSENFVTMARIDKRRKISHPREVLSLART